jgi:hypothetical protein
VAVLLLAGSAAAKPAKPVFSQSVLHYIPATIGGAKVVADPRSDIKNPAGTACEVPQGGIVLSTGDAAATSHSWGGVWDCPSGSLAGTNFVVGLDAAQYAASEPKLSKKLLYAPPTPDCDDGSITAHQLKIKGLPVTAFVCRATITEATPAGPAGTVFEMATAEPRKRLVATTAVVAGADPLPALTEMLQAGAS